MNKWDVLGHTFKDLGDLLYTECENMAVNCSRDPGFECMYEHYAIMLRALTTQHALIQDAFAMLEARFSTDGENADLAESVTQLAEDLEGRQAECIRGLW